ncbi:hypothetical protein TNCV_3246241 [Trichonephila clavipes]|nr:hypothetical protein TNCV_3246241 [Trichonephila clavipes]
MNRSLKRFLKVEEMKGVIIINIVEFNKEYSTTQLRPVFDAACKEKSNFSPNDCLEKGLNLLDTIPSLQYC